MKVKSRIGIPGNEMADRLANEAAEECMKARQFDCDVSQEYCEPFKDKFWIQQEVQVSTPTGASKKLESLRDLHSCLSQRLHAKYKLGSSIKTLFTSNCGNPCNHIEIKITLISFAA